MNDSTRKSILKSKRPLPSSPSRLHGSFNGGSNTLSAPATVEEFLRRAELTADPDQRLMQAQRVIGALMELTSINAPGVSAALFHKDVFARLSVLTSEAPDALVTMAGVAI